MGNLIDAYASHVHYAAHVLPVLDALPVERRGSLYGPSNLRQFLPDRTRYDVQTLWASDAPILVAAFQDARMGGRRPKVLCQHGASQRYLDAPESPSYDGGPGREHIGLFVCPNHASVDANLARYPNAHGVAVGDPALDAYIRIPAPRDGTVAFTTHWDCRVSPFSGNAWQTWRDPIAALAQERKVIGTSHPRARRDIEQWCQATGIEYMPDPAEVLARCDLLCADNTSFAVEAAACGRPIVWLNDPAWDKNVEHGGRFWDWPRGQVQVNEGDDLRFAVAWAFEDLPSVRTAREAMVESVYGPVDGKSAARAAEAVLGWEAECLTV